MISPANTPNNITQNNFRIYEKYIELQYLRSSFILYTYLIIWYICGIVIPGIVTVSGMMTVLNTEIMMTCQVRVTAQL